MGARLAREFGGEAPLEVKGLGRLYLNVDEELMTGPRGEGSVLDESWLTRSVARSILSRGP